MGLTVRLKQTTPGIVTLLPVGRVDTNSSKILSKELNKALEGLVKTLVINMEGVTFVSSVGISVLIKAKAAATGRNAEFAMINLQPQVKKAFEIVSLLPRLNVFESVRELDEYLEKVQQRVIDEDFKV